MNTIALLQSALDASSLRQKVISNNIANAQTPGYKAQQVNFEDILKQQLNNQMNGNQMQLQGTRTDPRHFIIGSPNSIPTAQIVTNNDTTLQNNGNNVDIDSEMTNMGNNALWYDALSQQANSEFQQLSIAITGRS